MDGTVVSAVVEVVEVGGEVVVVDVLVVDVVTGSGATDVGATVVAAACSSEPVAAEAGGASLTTKPAMAPVVPSTLTAPTMRRAVRAGWRRCGAEKGFMSSCPRGRPSFDTEATYGCRVRDA